MAVDEDDHREQDGDAACLLKELQRAFERLHAPRTPIVSTGVGRPEGRWLGTRLLRRDPHLIKVLLVRIAQRATEEIVMVVRVGVLVVPVDVSLVHLQLCKRASLPEHTLDVVQDVTYDQES
eukprot:7384609-Prymnesium_polylepis.2